MGIFTNRDNKKRYCVFCGKELADGKCTACGREAKEVVAAFFPELAEGADGSGRRPRGAEKSSCSGILCTP